MTSNPANVRLTLGVLLLLLLAGRRIFYGLQRRSPTWIAVGVIFLLLAGLRIWGASSGAGTLPGPLGYGRGSSGSAGAVNPPTPAPVRVMGKDPTRKPGQDGWSGRYEDPRGIVIRVSIAPPNSQQGRDAAAVFAGARKVGAVATVALRNNSTRPVRLDTAGAALYFTDGTQDYPSDPAAVIASAASAGSERASQLQGFGPPYHVAVGTELTQGVLFLPPDGDFANLDHIRLTLDGKWVDIPGQVVRGGR